TRAKIVACCGCNRSYRYFTRPTGTGNATAFRFFNSGQPKQKALERRKKNLPVKLNKVMDPVPCLNCGTFKHLIIPSQPTEKRTTLFFLGAFIGVIAASIYQFLN